MFERTRHWFVYGGTWVLLALYYTTWDLLSTRDSFLWLLALNFSQNFVWAMAGLLIIWLAHRHPIEGFTLRAWKAWVLNLGTGFLLAVLGLGIAWYISMAFSGFIYWPKDGQALRKALGNFYSMYFHSVLLILWAVLGAYHGFLMNRRMRSKELETAQLESALAQARHQALQAQLQPHFLFNTLHSISALIHLDPEAADRMVTRLADLLRLTLDHPADQLIPLRKEIAATEVYLAIEQVRFQDRLEVQVEIPSELASARVPSFILQPIVENALKHGISGKAKGGKIWIRAKKEGDWLLLEVQDDGVGYSTDREGIGLSNTRSRLALLFKDRQSLEIFSVRDKGTRVIIRIPLI